ncbi:serine hydrolase [Galbibacter sp. EGI 63066]|nr:serine hydrolase [Galbibacter sp. EGI 63066]
MKKLKRLFSFLLLVLIIIFAVVAYFNYPKLTIISGFSAKNMCSCVFNDQRNSTYTAENDNDFPPVNFAKNEVDKAQKASIASVLGLKPRKAVYRKGLGCVLIPETKSNLPKKFIFPKRTKSINRLPYPYGNKEQKDTAFSNLDYKKINATVKAAFKNNDVQKTRSVLVIYKDHIIAEKYSDSIDKDSKLLGWSMTKSVLATLYGILQYQGKLNINDPAKVDAWQNDERRNITYSNLLHMNSGLEWEEDYSTISDVTKMLYQDEDMTKRQAEKVAKYPPDTHWNYSSGTSNLLSGLLQKEFDNYRDYVNFPYEALIDRIGMNSMIIETDLAGNYVASSYGWATTRDWGKFGLLYLHNGNWNGDQLFDKSWVDYVNTPATASEAEYGGHFWLQTLEKLPDVPSDTYYADGFQGKRVYIVPSKDLVVVRMGLASGDAFDFNGFLSGITSSIK